MNDVKKAGLWMLAIGVATMLAMFILMTASRVSDPNGVPIVPGLLVVIGGGVAVVGLVVTLIGMRKNGSTHT